MAATTLRPLRRTGSGELALATIALMAAAVLGASPPPAAARGVQAGFDVSGTDFGTTVRVQLTTTSVQPGPNRFVVKVVDYDSKTPVAARRVSLRFTPLDDRGVTSTTLALAPGDDHSSAGSGANLAFDGRWRVTVLIERAGDSVEVPLEVEVRGPTQFVSIERTPGEPPKYTVEVEGLGHIRFSPDPERAGPSKVYVTCYTVIGEDPLIDEIVVTAAVGHGAMREVPVRRLERSRFVADVELQPGLNRLAAVGRSPTGARLRAAVDLTVPRD